MQVSRTSTTRTELWSRVFLAASIVVQIAIAWRFRNLTWDDSAITLGFARTFASTGRIEPTPGSGIVEGYSTQLWMLLMAAAAKVIHSPYALLAFAKICSLVLNIFNLLLIRKWFGAWRGEAFGNVLAGIVGFSFMAYESINGMETPLLMFLILAMLVLRDRETTASRIGYVLLGLATVLIRFEAIWLLVPFVLTEKRFRPAAISAVLWGGFFLLTEAFRKWYFGDWVPNTVIAKHGPPYATLTAKGELLRHLHEPFAFFTHLGLFLLVVAVVLAIRPATRSLHFDRSRLATPLGFTLLFTVFVFVLTTAIGKNWGPGLRSFYPAFPFLMALLFSPLLHLEPKERHYALAAVCFVSLIMLGERVHQMKYSKKQPAYMPGATVNDIARTEHHIEAIQNASGRTDLLYAGADMGSVMLFSHGVRVLDLGLLCDKVMAHKRYTAVDSYVIQDRHPDIIEVHSMWTVLVPLQDSPTFLADYRPLVVGDQRFFVRRDLLAQIPANRLTRATFVPISPRPAMAEDYADDDLNQKFGTYSILN